MKSISGNPLDLTERFPRSVLRYPGGKSRILKSILEFVPENFKEYREPFVGGGSLFLWLLKNRPRLKFWINDINEDLIAFWSTLKTYGEQLANEALRIKNENKDGRALFCNFKRQNVNDLETFDRGLRFFILNRITYSGLVDVGGYSKESFKKRFTENSIENLRLISPKLRDVKITQGDYGSLLKSSEERVFLFIDPPYETAKTSKLYGKRGVYGTNFDSKRLIRELISCQHDWLLTYDKSEQIKESYSKFAIVEERTVQYGTNFRSQNRPAKKGKELFIHNYKIIQENRTNHSGKQNHLDDDFNSEVKIHP
jgi:DNA adenine methylase